MNIYRWKCLECEARGTFRLPAADVAELFATAQTCHANQTGLSNDTAHPHSTAMVRIGMAQEARTAA